MLRFRRIAVVALSATMVAASCAADDADRPLRSPLGWTSPDGFPSIDDPSFHRAATVAYLGENDPVVALEIDGDVRAYPLEILIWHDLVNDTVAGIPVSVAYCPLCNSVTVHDREIQGRVLDFGVSGLLDNSSLLMYDRQTETLWSHFAGEPLHGVLSDAELVSRPATIVGFGTWQAEYPDGIVLNRDIGRTQDYGINPYPGDDDVDAQPFLFEGDVPSRHRRRLTLHPPSRRSSPVRHCRNRRASCSHRSVGDAIRAQRGRSHRPRREAGRCDR